MGKSDLSMYKGLKEIFDGRFLPHKYNRILNIRHKLSLTPNIDLRFARSPVCPLVQIDKWTEWTRGQNGQVDGMDR